MVEPTWIGFAPVVIVIDAPVKSTSVEDVVVTFPAVRWTRAALVPPTSAAVEDVVPHEKLLVDWV
jgi:hypothetical protein